MSSAASKSNDWVAGLAAGCGRFVPASVGGDAERERRRRFVGVALASPFLVVLAAMLVLFGTAEPRTVLAFLCGVGGISWFAALLVASGLPQILVEIAALAVATAVAAVVVAAAGGAASPMALMVLALAFEPWWVRRRTGAALAGAAAAAGAIAFQYILSAVALLPAAGPVSGWQWLVPLAYAATLWLRRDSFAPVPSREDDPEEPRLETLVDAVVLRLSPTGEVLDVSAQSARILHLSPELLLGSSFFERIHLADRVGYLSALADMREGAASRRIDLRLRLPRDGAADNHRFFAMELLSAGEGRDFVALIRDDSAGALLRERLAEAVEAADSTEIAKSRFLAAVSHELRTPLNAIIGFSDMLAYEMFGAFSDPRQKEYVTLIRESGHHLLSVVNSILDVSKIEAGTYAIHPEPFAFREAADMCAAMITPQAQAKSIALTVHVAASVGELTADRRAVRQMLINLLSNAVKFTPDGGRVDIGARRSGANLSFWVADTGIGISERDLQRLGQPFMQVQNDYTRQFEGTGLGLSLVKGLVALHHGAMDIESAPGEGTKVTITLPLDGGCLAEAGASVKPVTVPVRIENETAHGTEPKAALAG